MTENEPERQWRERRRFAAADQAALRIDRQTRDMLVTAYLDGEAQAVWVLQDFIEFAHLPKIKPAGLDQRVRYVLALLPPSMAHELACDFFEHVITRPSLRQAVETKRQWLAEQIDDARLKAVRSRFTQPRASGVQLAASLVLSSSPSPSNPQRVQKEMIRMVGQGRERQEVGWQAARIRSRIGHYR